MCDYQGSERIILAMALNTQILSLPDGGDETAVLKLLENLCQRL